MRKVYHRSVKMATVSNPFLRNFPYIQGKMNKKKVIKKWLHCLHSLPPLLWLKPPHKGHEMHVDPLRSKKSLHRRKSGRCFTYDADAPLKRTHPPGCEALC